MNEWPEDRIRRAKGDPLAYKAADLIQIVGEDKRLYYFPAVSNITMLYGGLSFIPNCLNHPAWQTHLFAFQEFFGDYLLAACLAELRHFGYKRKYHAPELPLKRTPTFIATLYDFCKDDIGQESRRNWGAKSLWNYYKDSDKPLRTVLNEIEFAFSQYAWSGAYGGFNWAYIIRVAKRFIMAQTIPDILFSLDSVLHAVHASGSFMGGGRFEYMDTNCFNHFLSWKRVACSGCYYRELTYCDTKYKIEQLPYFDELLETVLKIPPTKANGPSHDYSSSQHQCKAVIKAKSTPARNKDQEQYKKSWLYLQANVTHKGDKTKRRKLVEKISIL
jgi:hypothetical protein